MGYPLVWELATAPVLLRVLRSASLLEEVLRWVQAMGLRLE